MIYDIFILTHNKMTRNKVLMVTILVLLSVFFFTQLNIIECDFLYEKRCLNIL